MARGLSTEFRRSPEAKVRKLDVATGTQLEHGEKTWTTDQLARDLLQNHLDAQTDVFVEQLVTAVTQRLPDTATSQDRAAYEELEIILWRFQKYLRPTDAASAATWLGEQLQLFLKEHGGFKKYFRPDVLKRFNGVHINLITERLGKIVEHAPTISYKIRDTAGTPPTTAWLNDEELTDAAFVDTDRFVIVGWKIQDAGSGFDTKLQSLYKSTKAKPFERGRFGEGMKMSHLHALRHGAMVKVRSGYTVNDGTYHLWQSHPLIAPDHSLHVRGVEITKPAKPTDHTGSITLLDFSTADDSFAGELRTAIDPRSNGLAKNCIEFSSDRYLYFSDYPSVGVSREASPDQLSVQGLHVVGETNTYRTSVFAYDCLQADILGGRDRHQVSGKAKDAIEEFWQQSLPPDLLRECLQRLTIVPEKGSAITEEDALCLMLQSKVWLHGSKLEKQHETAQALVAAMIELYNLRSNTRYVFIKSDFVEREHLATAAVSLGIEVIQLDRVYSDDFLNQINEYLRPHNIIVYSQDEFQKKALKDTAFTEAEDMSAEQRELQTKLENYIVRTRKRLENTMRHLGLDRNSTNLQSVVTYSIAEVAPDYRNLVDIHWDETKKTFRFIVTIPDSPANAVRLKEVLPGIETRLEQLIEVFYAATVKRNRPFRSAGEVQEVAQDNIENWHDRSLLYLHPHVAQLPTDFQHTIDTTLAKEVNPFEKSKRTRPQELASWASVRQARSRQTPLADLARLYRNRSTISPGYVDQVVSEIENRVEISDDDVSFVDTTDPDNAVVTSATPDLEQTDNFPKRIGQLTDGRPVIQLAYARFCFSLALHDGEIVSYQKKKLIYFDGELYTFSDESPYSGQIIMPYYVHSTDQVIIHPTAVVFNDYQADPATAVADLQDIANAITVEAPDLNTPPRVDVMPTTLLSDITKEFGRESWDNPVRLIQDIVQNHLDAARGGSILIEFEVQRGHHRSWVESRDVQPKETIVGFRVSDSGSGYAPHNIHKLGSTSKVSPLFRGKYGEGQKMVAAAAARHGLSLDYGSVVYHQGVRTRWQAKTVTIPEQIIVRGQPTTIDRVAFTVASQPEVDSTITSHTTLRLPEGTPLDAAGQQVWDAMIEAIHPHKQDDRGYAGLERYIRSLRKPSKQVIDLGYMKILLDEPGAVYENGLLISTTEELTVGYDVPAITSTRERNAVDQKRLSGYISTALSECTDKRFIEVLVRKFFSSTWNQLQNNSSTRVQEVDQRWDLHRQLPMLLSRPLWDEVISAHRPEVFVHSDKYYRDMYERATTEKEVSEALDALHAARRLKKRNPLNVDSYTFKELENFFPTSLQIGQAMRGYEVTMTPTTQEQLYNAVAAQAHILMEWASAAGRQTEATRLRSWLMSATDRETKAIVLSPLNALTLGSVDSRKDKPVIALNEQLLASGKRVQLAAVTQHELIHHATEQPDFDVGFLGDLLSVIRFNLQRSSRVGKTLHLMGNLLREE